MPQKNYCVIGYPIQHSLSPRLYNREFKKRGIAARYHAVEVKPENLSAFMKTFRERFEGANVTIPHKENVMRFLDVVSREARAIGAVNTIVKKKGKGGMTKLYGYNTDVTGCMEALKKNGVRVLKNKRVLVLGAGGAARAVVYCLTRAGAHVTVANRTLAHAKKLARAFGCDAIKMNAENINPADFYFIINATSGGMWAPPQRGLRPQTKETPLPDLARQLAPRAPHQKLPIVMDIVYRPRLTVLLKDAKKSGCRIITGDHMFLAQAAQSFKLFKEPLKNIFPAAVLLFWL